MMFCKLEGFPQIIRLHRELQKDAHPKDEIKVQPDDQPINYSSQRGSVNMQFDCTLWKMYSQQAH